MLRVRLLGAFAFLALALAGAGIGSLAATVEEQRGTALRLGLVSALLALGLLGMQGAYRHRLRGGDRLVVLAIIGGVAALIGLLALLFSVASAVVGDWGVAAATWALLGAAGAVAAGSYAIYRRSGPQVLPPFEPLRPESFKDNPDPPAYAPPPIPPRVMHQPGGFVDRLLKALGLRR